MTRDTLPLAGRRVAVTRPEEDAAELALLLAAAGAVPVVMPLTGMLPPVDDGPLRDAITGLEQYDWIIFTSVRAVRAACAIRPAPWSPGRPAIAAVGDATAAEVLSLTGRAADLIPPIMRGGEIVPAILESHTLRNARVLWPRAESPRRELPRDLIAAGALLDAPVAYRTIQYADTAIALNTMAAAGEIDAITLTAPSAAACLAGAMTEPAQCVIAVIGPSTAAAARELGLPVHVEAETPIMSALVTALEHHFSSRQAT